MSSRIEELIGEIEEYIDGCKLQAFSSTKIIVDKGQMEELLSELRHRTPEEIKKYQKIISNKDAILENAQSQADAVYKNAQDQADKLVSESEITKRAYEQANDILTDAQRQADEIVDNANKNAADIQNGAISYTDDMLNSLDAIISGTMNDAGNRYNALMSTLSDHQNIVRQNRKELNSSEEEPEIQPFFGDEESSDADEEEVPTEE